MDKTKIVSIKLGANDPTITRQNETNVVRTTKDDYVTYGEDDLQFQYLININTYSPTQSAVISQLTRMVYGEGLNDPSVISEKDLRKLVSDFVSFNNGSLQVLQNADEDQKHLPVNYLRPRKLQEGETEITTYGFLTDWTSANHPTPYPAWKKGTKEKISIYYFRPYAPNEFYFALPTYQAGLTYMEQEMLMAETMLNDIKTGFSPSFVLNFNNGTATPEERKQHTKEIEKTLAGKEGKRFITSYNDHRDAAATIESVQHEGVAERYTQALENAQSQIIKVNGISSPVVLGLPTSNGFSSTADELREAKIRFINDKVKPIQQFLADGLNEITGRTDLEFLNDTAGEEDEVIEDEDSTDIAEQNLEENSSFDMLISLGTDSLEGYELFNEGKVEDDESNDEILQILSDEFKPNKTFLERINLVGTGKATPTRDSEQDNENYAVRYRYKGSHGSERAFCKAMTKANRIYRKEDIVRMADQKVNPGFGKNGTDKYDIWLYKGGGLLSDEFPGGTCRHYWGREIYLKSGTGDKRKANLNRKISVAEARRQGFRPESNNRKVGTTPHSNYTSRN